MYSLLIYVIGYYLFACSRIVQGYSFPATWKHPGKFKTRDTPQFILFTHDDNTDKASTGYVTDVTKRHKNPNGCHINAAFYTTQRYSDCATVKKMYKEGHEIGAHSVTHRKTNRLSSSEKKKEIEGVRKWLIDTCGIPAKDVRGWRSPYLADDAEIRTLLDKAGFEYDTSIPEHYNSKTSPSASKRLWPYSMSKGIKQMDSCKYFGVHLNNCQANEKHNLIEIPMWMYQKGPGRPSSNNLMDPPNAFKVLKAELDRNYNANKAPVGIWTHSTSTGFLNKANNRKEVSKFLSYALKKDGVWVVTPSQLLDWMKNPVPKSQMDQFMSKYTCS